MVFETNSVMVIPRMTADMLIMLHNCFAVNNHHTVPLGVINQCKETKQM